jgi:chemotaxis signal transduction protein
MALESNSNQDIYQVMILNQQHFAVPVQSILSVLPLEKMLSLPDTPNWLTGVVHIRNAIVPVLNLNLLLKMDSIADDSGHPLLALLRHPQDSQRWLALCVSDITQLIDAKALDGIDLSSSSDPLVKQVVDIDSQQLYLLDISNLFEHLMTGKG